MDMRGARKKEEEQMKTNKKKRQLVEVDQMKSEE